jgi:hypothetical protein
VGPGKHSGLCVVRGKHPVLIDRRAPLADRLRVLARALGDLRSEAVYMAPEARELVDRSRPGEALDPVGVIEALRP